MSFRSFFIGSVSGQKAPEQDNSQEKWDVVLFVGNYDPITKDEHERIKQFIAKIIKGDQASKFAHDVDIGVIINEQLEEESYFEEKSNYGMTFEDKEFITGKLFGLKIFPVNYKQLMWLTMSQEDKERAESNNEKVNKIVSKIQKSFQKANILIVLREDDSHSLKALGEIIHKFSNNDINIGFMVWKHEPIKNVILENIPICGDIIKAICLMDFERPNPEDLKSFSYKYRLSKHLDHIRSIHFKVGGEKYLLPFTSMFPDLVIYGDEEYEDKKSNYIFVMEILKKMFLGEEYENRIAEHNDDKGKDILPSGGSTGGGGGAGAPPGGSSGPGAGTEASPEKPPGGEAGAGETPEVPEAPETAP